MRAGYFPAQDAWRESTASSSARISGSVILRRLTTAILRQPQIAVNTSEGELIPEGNSGPIPPSPARQKNAAQDFFNPRCVPDRACD